MNLKIKTLALFALIIFFIASDARAATFTVTNNLDSGAGSLRDAVTTAAAGAGADTINFSFGATPTTITVNSIIAISAANGSITVNGTGANLLTIDGGPGLHGIFSINNSTVVFNDTKFINAGGVGDALNGGAFTLSGTSDLSLIRTWFDSNRASGGGAAAFVNPTSTLRVLDSAMTNNIAVSECTAIDSQGILFMANTTIFGNSNSGNAGGFCSVGTATIRNTTVTGNSVAGSGGGAFLAGTLNIGNTVIAGNIDTNTGNGGNSPDIYNIAAVTSVGANFIGRNGDTPGAAFAVALGTTPNANGDYVGTLAAPISAGLAATAADNGGTTPTVAILAGSFLIDRGNNANAVFPGTPSVVLTTDQRGSQRIVDGDLNTTPIVDIGAYEYLASTAADVTISGRVLNNNRPVANAVVKYIDQNGEQRIARTNQFGYYSFEDIEAGQTNVFQATAKGLSFAPKVVTTHDAQENLDFEAL